MLVVLVGARGSGKTTLLSALKDRGFRVLQPSTTRAQRSQDDTEYDFVKTWRTGSYAWSIQVGDDTYGLRKSELDKAVSNTCITVFEPLNLPIFEEKRKTFGVETMTVGLCTISNVAEQHQRVTGDEKRKMNEAELARVTVVVSECDVVLTGDATTVLSAVLCLIKLFEGRGGVLTKDYLIPLIRAGSLITGADQDNIRPASYDLRIGTEILCQGKTITLTYANPRFEIPPYSYAVVGALEYASLPPFVIGRFDLKVSYFFEGVILSNGPQIDPGYKGALFCMLYNGSGRPRLLTLEKQFATIDFTTTTTMTEGYRQKYQLKQRMGQFLTNDAVQGQGGAIVEFINQKVGKVDRKIKSLRRNFWTIAAAFIALAVVVPTLVVPVAWNEIGILHSEKQSIEEEQNRETRLIDAARQERSEASAILAQSGQRLNELTVLLQAERELIKPPTKVVCPPFPAPGAHQSKAASVPGHPEPQQQQNGCPGHRLDSSATEAAPQKGVYTR